MTPSAFAERFARDRSGSSAVEFAIIAPALFVCIVGIVVLGISYYEGATIQWSLERSLRTTMVEGHVTSAAIQAAMADDLERLGSPDVAFHYSVDTSGAVPLAIVIADYDAPLRIPFLPDISLHFSAENVAPIPAS